MGDPCTFHDDVEIDYCPLCRIEELESGVQISMKSMRRAIASAHEKSQPKEAQIAKQRILRILFPRRILVEIGDGDAD